MASAAGCIRAQWKGAETASITARLAPFAFAMLNGALDGRLVAGDDDLPAAVVVGDLADLALRSLARHLARGLDIEAEQRRHGALPDRHGALHGVAADAQEPRRVGERQAAGGGERRIFAERMAGDERRVAMQIESRLGLEHAHGGEADRHQGRLRVGRQGQFVGRALQHHARQLLRQRVVHLLEHRPRLRKSLGERLAHADGLAALPRKDERARHADPVATKTRGPCTRQGREIKRARTEALVPPTHSV